MCVRSFSLALLSAASAVALAGAARAEDEQPQSVSEVVVTARSETQAASATKQAAPILETPQSISVVDRGELDMRVVENLNQALRFTAGVGPETRGSTGTRYDLLTLRGFTPEQYLDGLRVIGSQNGYAAPQIDITRLDRVEIVKGPASVLYGQSSPGGIVALTSKRPTFAPFGEAAVTGGSFGAIQGEVDVGGPSDAQGKLAFRLTAMAERTDTEIGHTEAERYAINPALTWRPDAHTEWTLLYSYQNDPEGGDYGAEPPQGSLLPNPNGRIARDFYSSDPSYEDFTREQNAVTSLFTRDLGFGDWGLHQNTRFMRTTTRYRSLYSFSINPNLRTIPRFVARADEGVDSLTSDTNIGGTLVTGPVKHSLLFGVDYQHTGQREVAGFGGDGGTLDIFAPVYGDVSVVDPGDTFSVRLNLQQTGAYAQDQLFWGGWRLLLSGRYDWVEAEQFDRIFKTTAKLDQEKFTGRAGLLYLFPNGVAPYASYSTSFFPQTSTDKNGKILPPTEGKQTEVGVKYQPRVWDALLTLSLYDLRQTNVATQDPSVPFGFGSIAAGEIRSRGVELEGSAKPRPGLELKASYTYLDNMVTKDNTALKGTRPYAVPQQTANGFGRYTFQSGALQGFGLGGGVRFLGQSFNGVAGPGEFKIPSATLFDILASYDLAQLSPRLKGASLDVAANNIGGARYISSCYSTIWCWYGQGRSIQATARYRW